MPVTVGNVRTSTSLRWPLKANAPSAAAETKHSADTTFRTDDLPRITAEFSERETVAENVKDDHASQPRKQLFRASVQ